MNRHFVLSSIILIVLAQAPAAIGDQWMLLIEIPQGYTKQGKYIPRDTKIYGTYSNREACESHAGPAVSNYRFPEWGRRGQDPGITTECIQLGTSQTNPATPQPAISPTPSTPPSTSYEPPVAPGLPGSSTPGQIYRWKDEKGQWHFSQQAPNPGEGTKVQGPQPQQPPEVAK